MVILNLFTFAHSNPVSLISVSPPADPCAGAHRLGIGIMLPVGRSMVSAEDVACLVTSKCCDSQLHFAGRPDATLSGPNLVLYLKFFI